MLTSQLWLQTMHDKSLKFQIEGDTRGSGNSFAHGSQFHLKILTKGQTGM